MRTSLTLHATQQSPFAFCACLWFREAPSGSIPMASRVFGCLVGALGFTTISCRYGLIVSTFGRSIGLTKHNFVILGHSLINRFLQPMDLVVGAHCSYV